MSWLRKLTHTARDPSDAKVTAGPNHRSGSRRIRPLYPLFFVSPALLQKYTCMPGRNGPRGARDRATIARRSLDELSSVAQAHLAACLI